MLTEIGACRDFGMDSRDDARMVYALLDTCARLHLDPGLVDRIVGDVPIAPHDSSACPAEIFEELGTRMSVCHLANTRLFQIARGDSHADWSFDTRQTVGKRLALLYQDYEIKLADLLRDVTANDSTLLLQKFHSTPAIMLNFQHFNQLLDIVDEKTDGEIAKHQEAEHRYFFEGGGGRYEATDPATLRAVFSKLNCKPGASFYDLGSGYGHPILYGASILPGVSFTGIELMSARVDSARVAAQRLGLVNANFRTADVTTCDFSAADVVFLFNPFVEVVAEYVSEKLAALASSKPILIIDYFGAVTSKCQGSFCQIGEAGHMYGLYTSPKYSGEISRSILNPASFNFEKNE